MVRVLLTGAGGFLGLHVARELAEAGHEVRGFGRSPRPPAFAGADWRTGDVVDAEALAAAAAGCGAIVHLAAMPLAASAADPAAALRVNAGGTLAALEAAREAGVPKFVHASTAQVYGRPERAPVAEDVPPAPHHVYAATKLAGEALVRAFASAHGLDAGALRFFNVAGPDLAGRARDTVEGIFVRRALAGEPIVLRPSPDEARDFVHARDAARAVGLALERHLAGLAVNIGTGRLTTLADLAAAATRAAGSASEIRAEVRPGPLQRLAADTRLAARALGFTADIPLEDTLAELVAAERARLPTPFPERPPR